MASTLGPRGMSLWNAYVGSVAGERDRVVLEEACRTADRLDRLDALLTGKTDEWFRLVDSRGSDVLEVQVDSVLSEARQQALALRQLLGSLEVKESDDDDGDSWLDDGVPAAFLNSP